MHDIDILWTILALDLTNLAMKKMSSIHGRIYFLVWGAPTCRAVISNISLPIHY